MVFAAEIKQEIPIPQGVTVTISGRNVSVKGPKGEQSREFENNSIEISQSGTNVVLSCKMPKRKQKAMIGTTAGHIKNLMRGVKDGFTYHMKVYYSHFPMNISVQGDKVIIKNFLGEKYPRESQIVGKTKVTVKGQDITIEGINREDVGQTAANLQLATRVGRKDPRVFQDGIFISDKGEK